jgi:uncharacterized protein YjiS (DUF1127 family)
VAYAHTLPEKSHAQSAAHPLADALKRAWRGYWQRRAQRATVQMLNGLDDHMLKDLGMARGEIQSVVYGRRGERRHRYEANWE